MALLTRHSDIVLLGAGHAHVEVMRRFARHPEREIHLTLIGREPQTPYSGMLPGLVRGEYGFDQAHIDLAPLAAAARARLIVAEADGVDLALRSVSLIGRPKLPFDLLSIDIGGEPAMPAAGGIPVKPIGRFLERLDRLETSLASGARIVVVGAGPAGTELALALARRLHGRARIVLVGAGAEPLEAAPPRARAVVRRALIDAGVELVSGARAGALVGGRLALSDGSFLDADAVLWASSVIGPAFLAASGLACDAAGCVRVDPTLRSLSHPFVFAAGDCAALEGAARPKAGVWAVRAGAPLAANLRRVARGGAPRAWRPQRRALTILGLGDGRAIAWRNGIAVSGPLMWRWKDWIDRRWMRMYAMRMTPVAEDPTRLGGRGAKLGAEALTAVLAGLIPAARPDILLGFGDANDGAIMLPPSGQALVQSVDHLRDSIGDPFMFGQIAAAHALSAIHAMGAKPWTALAVATVGYAAGGRMDADLAAMMQGAAWVLEVDGCALVGLHSGDAPEPSLSFAVSGLVDPRRAWRKSGLRVGDALLLTKALGSGVVLAGRMRGLTRACWLEAGIAAMRRSNADAARILRAHGVVACTAVAGSGLAGHLMEMLRASTMSATLCPNDVPLLPGALELARAGVESTLASGNRRVLLGAERRAVIDLMIDPQTSGGLLAGLAADRAGACVAALRLAGLDAAVVGGVRAVSEAGAVLHVDV